METGAERVCELLAPDGPDPDGPEPEALPEIAGRALAAIRELDDETKVTADAVRSLGRLSRLRDPTWKEITSATGMEAGKRSGAHDCLDDLRAYCECVRRMPRLHDDVRRYARLLARQTLALGEAYREHKRERGLLDFVDLEVMLLDALRTDRTIRGDLAATYDLLFVDEFQDSSPIQLAIFLELHDCVGRSVWVGDEKQSIYGFRNADLDLVRAAWRLLDPDAVDPLDTSYRAHRGLVEVLNGIFVPVFGEEARLKADEGARDGAVERWFLEATNKGQDQRALAAGVRQLLDEGVAPDDIAVLVRTNRTSTQVADVLAEQRIPAVVQRPGLLRTRECAAARAGVGVVADPYDALAAAEVLHLLGDPTEETPSWLEPRLRKIERRREECEEAEGGATDSGPPWPDEPALASLRDLDPATRSPSDVVRSVIQRLDLPDRIARWGEPARRAANLDALVDLARAYEEEAREDGRAASLRGLLARLDAKEADEDDHLPVPRSVGAVTVSTVHSAKGLEWPVVILCELNKVYEPDLWEPDTEGGRVEEGRPLEGRRLRAWVWPFGYGGGPFGGRVAGTGLDTDALAAPEGSVAAEKERREAERLLYVGMTRAKEKLVLAHRGSPADGPDETDWLELVPHHEVLDPSLEEGIHDLEELPTTLRVRCLSEEMLDDADDSEPAQSRRLVEPSPMERAHPVRFRSPSGVVVGETAGVGGASREGGTVPAADANDSEAADGAPSGAAVEVVHEWDPETLDLNVRTDDWTSLGSAVHAYLAGLPSMEGLSEEECRAAAERALEGFGVAADLQPEDLVRLGARFREWVSRRYPDVRWWTEVPVAAPRHDGGQWRGSIDLLLVKEDGEAVVVDHKIAPVPREAWAEKAASYAGQLEVYRDALEAQDVTVAETLLHLVVGGGVVRVGFSRDPRG